MVLHVIIASLKFNKLLASFLHNISKLFKITFVAVLGSGVGIFVAFFKNRYFEYNY